MPYTLNGIGTWYYGKRNLFTYYGTCSQCGHRGELRAYDTTLFFVVVFIPLIPLGAKRIIDECPHCQRHRAMALKDYERARRQDLAAAVQEWQNQPASAEAATKVVSLAVGYRDPENFRLVAGPVENRFPADAAVLGLLASAHEFFGGEVEGERCWRKALALGPSDDVREALAANLCRQKRPDEAAPLLAPIVTQRQVGRIGLLYLAVESFQAIGRHKEALAFLEQIVQLAPAQADDKAHRRYVKLSQKHQATGKALASPVLAPARTELRGGWRWRAPRLIAAGLVLLVVSTVGIGFWKKNRSVEVWLVNGTSARQSILIDEHAYELSRYSHRPVRLAYGRHRVAARPQPPGQPPFDYELGGSWLERTFGSTTHILNPDRCGLLLRETVIYTNEKKPPAQPPEPVPPQLWVGETSYRLQGVNDVFTRPPAKITMSEHRSVENRYVLDQWRPPGELDAYQAIAEDKGPAAALAFLRQQTAWDPGNENWPGLLATMGDVTQALAAVRGWLAVRPVVVGAHRVYQSLTERADPGHDLAAEYRVLSEAEPDNQALRYLWGRVIADPAESARLLAASEEGPKPLGWGHYALAFSSAAAGHFEEAMARLTNALRVLSDSRDLRPQLLQATGRYGELLQQVQAARSADDPLRHVHTELLCLQRLGRSNDVQTRIRLALSSAEKMARADQLAPLRASLEATCAAAREDWTGFARHMAQTGPIGVYVAALVRGDLAGAEKAWAALEKHVDSWVSEATLALVAGQRGEAAAATRHAEQARAHLERGGEEERRVARWLAGQGPAPTPLELEQLAVWPDEKRLMLALLGQQRADLRVAAYALARRLNYEVDYRQALIARSVGAEGES